MGTGKSCIMRVLASKAATKFLSDHRDAPIFMRWRDVHDQVDLKTAIAQKLSQTYTLPFQELGTQSNLIFFLDGFDEMSSHDDSVISQCFERLAQLAHGGCTVVVAMRSTVITKALEMSWENRKAFVAQVQMFSDTQIDQWAQRWTTISGNTDVSGPRLRALAGGPPTEKKTVVQNPLLLYMLAKYVLPNSPTETRPLSRGQIFKIFVDETIRGKVRVDSESFPVNFDATDYRMLLQEFAFISAWPKCAPKCPVQFAKDRIPAEMLKEMNFQTIRTAFVLHFFEPGKTGGEEFEFQPEGFRHYLFAEWCVRSQLEAKIDESRPRRKLSKRRPEANNWLAQVPARDVERTMINDIYEELGALVKSNDDKLVDRLKAFGIERDKEKASALILELYDSVKDQATVPSVSGLTNLQVGVERPGQIPAPVDATRLLVNHWDQCILATFGLYRGMGLDPQKNALFESFPGSLGQFLRLRLAIYGPKSVRPQESDFNVSRIGLQGVDLRSLELFDFEAHNAILWKANLVNSAIGEGFYGADFSRADLTRAYVGFHSVRCDFRDASLELAYISDPVECEFTLQKARPGQQPTFIHVGRRDLKVRAKEFKKKQVDAAWSPTAVALGNGFIIVGDKIPQPRSQNRGNAPRAKKSGPEPGQKSIS